MNTFPEVIKKNQYINLIKNAWESSPDVLVFPQYGSLLIYMVYSWNLKVVNTYRFLKSGVILYRLRNVNNYLLSKFFINKYLYLPFYQRISFQISIINEQLIIVHPSGESNFVCNFACRFEENEILLSKTWNYLNQLIPVAINQNGFNTYLNEFFDIARAQILLQKLK